MDQHKQTMRMGWGRFAAMIATSTFIMFFLMYQLIYPVDHATFSVNRLLSALIMGAVMTVVMLGYMWSMYKGAGVKITVLTSAILIGGAPLYLNRSQRLIGDTAFMKAMIQLLASTGLRVGEALGLTWQDVRFADRTL